MLTTFKRLLRDDRGAAAIEYALIATLVGLGIVTAATNLGAGLSLSFNNIANQL